MTNSNRVVTQSNDIVAAINLARSEAITRNATITFCRADTSADTACSAGSAGSTWPAWVVLNGTTLIRGGDINNYGSTLKVTSTLTSNTATYSSDGLARTNGTLMNTEVIQVCHTFTKFRKHPAGGAGWRQPHRHHQNVGDLLMKSQYRASRHGQRGVGIIEILVAVLVLSIGLLGLAGLQMRTLRDNESALERGVAVFETHAIADAMRADRVNAIDHSFDIALTACGTDRQHVPRESAARLAHQPGQRAGRAAPQVPWPATARAARSSSSGMTRAPPAGISTFSITTQVQL